MEDHVLYLSGYALNSFDHVLNNNTMNLWWYVINSFVYAAS